MKPAILLLSLLAFYQCAIKKWGLEEEEDGIPVLDKNNFEPFIEDNPYVFVKFFAPWCGHCRKMAPEFSKLAERMHDEGGIPIAKLDVTKARKIGNRYHIKGFPTLILFKNGVPVEYNGSRKQHKMYRWLERKAGNASELVHTEEEFEELVNSPLAFLFVLPEDDELALKNYLIAANKFEDIIFAHTFNLEYARALDLSNPYSLIVFRDFDDGKRVWGSEVNFSVREIEDFVNKQSTPLVSHFDEAIAHEIFGNKNTAIVLFCDIPTSPAMETFKEVALQRKGEFLFSVAKRIQGIGGKLAEMANVTTKERPAALRIIEPTGDGIRKYVVKDLSIEGINEAIDDFKLNKLEPHYKSEEIPENDTAAVKTIVGKNFKKMILDTQDYVLLNTYAPWCHHCKNLDPVLEELAKRLLKHDDLLLSKMDATANEYPGLTVRGYPTLFFYKPGKKKPIIFESERTFDGILEFLEEEMNRKLLDDNERIADL